MKYTFDFSKMERLLYDFSNICDVRFSLIDNNNHIVCHSKELSSFCEKIGSTPEGKERCRTCDATTFNHAVKHKLPYYTYQCHAGIVETIIPIWFKDEAVGSIMLGQYINNQDKEQQWSYTLNQISSWYRGAEDLRDDFFSLTTTDRSIILSSTRILITCSNYICSECLIEEQKDSELQTLTEYIENNYQSKLSLNEISAALSISKTGLCNLAAKYDTTINTMIRKYRIQIARELLRSTSYPISEIGGMIGISDYNYFTKLFKSECNCTPTEYKKHTIASKFSPK